MDDEPGAAREGRQQMNQGREARAQNDLTEEKLPQCKRCNKPVENLTTSPHPSDEGQVIIEFNCHGETVSQEVSASLLQGTKGLAGYKVFNSMTSGMMPRQKRKSVKAERVSSGLSR